MTSLVATGNRLRALCDAAEVRAGSSGGALALLRTAGREAFLEQGLPHTKLEEWRYTNLAPLASLELELPEGDPPVDRALLEALATPVFACGLAVFANGRPRSELWGLAAGDVELFPLRSGSPVLGSLVDAKVHPLAALNAALVEDGIIVRIPDGAQIEHPIHLVFVSVSPQAPLVSSPRVVIEAGAGSRAVVVQDHVSIDAGRPHFTNAVTEVRVGENASLELVVLQREDDTNVHVSNLAVQQERDSRFASHTVTLGGRLVRNDTTAVLAGPGADCIMNGLYLGTGERLIDNHTLVDHAVPHGTSRELYKGVLADNSRGVFRGRIIVRPDAQKTDASQQNPNLLLNDGTEIDTKPQLEIYNDDVKCSHGAASGRIDEDALFYLRARGIGARDARALLTRGFATEILAALPGEALAEALTADFAARMTGGSDA